MKKKMFLLLIMIVLFTGCIKVNDMDDIDIITTIYPIEYVSNRIYGEHSNISSIYARGTNTKEVEFTNKQLNDFANYDLFIYNSESGEREYATYMLNQNKKLKIIDASYGLEITSSTYDIWSNPANILMIAQNIKDELNVYINNEYLKREINENYENLKVDISELESEFKRTADNSINQTIIVNDEALLFLRKYGFNVINLTENGQIKENDLEMVKNLFKNNEVSYVFVHEFETNTTALEELINNYGAKEKTFKLLETITEEDLESNEDYLSIMHKNIEALKEETYK